MPYKSFLGRALREKSKQYQESLTAQVWFVGEQISIEIKLEKGTIKSKLQGLNAMKIIFHLAKTMARQDLAFRVMSQWK